ncbi:hypothetical protein BT67DRAFT_3606 [Trichocladium antarcticum]|uniref:Uncharacterized protein n=1 Tax=Trichocladium antarcticum TaxID=1450529 RepID=A0AAN6USG1_9PEZI|nr:hypothetical protein BT67DRAFT_3606 [Trichocladium antarcticum]
MTFNMTVRLGVVSKMKKLWCVGGGGLLRIPRLCAVCFLLGGYPTRRPSVPVPVVVLGLWRICSLSSVVIYISISYVVSCCMNE